MINRLDEILESKYADCKESLAEISRDENNGQVLCDMEQLFFNYDKILKELYGGQTPFSPDLIHCKDGKVILIEFKNATIGNPKAKMNLKLKGIEGGFLAIYELLAREYPDVTFEEVVELDKRYLIVYSGGKNPEKASESRTGGIQTHLVAATARFGLDRYNGTFFKRVQTITEATFESMIDKIS